MIILTTIFFLLVVLFAFKLTGVYSLRLIKTMELCESLAESNKKLSEELTVINAANTMMNMKINRLEDKQLEREEFYAEESRKEA